MAKPALLHQILAHLKPSARNHHQQHLLRTLTTLHQIPSVWGISAGQGIGGPEDLSFCILTFLQDATALDEFGPHPLHMEYLQRHFVPRVSSFVSADIPLTKAPPARYGAVHSFCFNLRSDASQEMIRRLFQELRSLTAIPGVLGVEAGATMSWRQQFQAAGVIYLESVGSARRYLRHPLRQELHNGLWRAVTTEGMDVIARTRAITP